ncbi:type II toxin-antitoxin system Phd/YefM family antitoxin [Caldimonas sp.]|uniref:type II toxin-antitoxin system Phd/YefM family antitoxin n=1 Tax=Caldimonas sp. TaxID=2838790 RepID=UPI00391B0964
MEKAITSAQANRQFSFLLRGVREGHRYVVTSHGKPVARLMPVETDDPVAAKAREALLQRLAGQAIVQAGRWTRDELYEDR